jgi:hypothetical protein
MDRTGRGASRSHLGPVRAAAGRAQLRPTLHRGRQLLEQGAGAGPSGRSVLADRQWCRTYVRGAGFEERLDLGGDAGLAAHDGRVGRSDRATVGEYARWCWQLGA